MPRNRIWFLPPGLQIVFLSWTGPRSARPGSESISFINLLFSNLWIVLLLPTPPFRKYLHHWASEDSCQRSSFQTKWRARRWYKWTKLRWVFFVVWFDARRLVYPITVDTSLIPQIVDLKAELFRKEDQFKRDKFATDASRSVPKTKVSRSVCISYDH